MINEYHRPMTVEEAVSLLMRKDPKTLPLGGGTILSKSPEDVAVVDLQDLGLDKIQQEDGRTILGSMVKLETLIRHYGKSSTIGRAIQIEAGQNIRNMATIGGTFVAGGGRSALLTVLLASQAEVVMLPGNVHISVEQWLKERSGLVEKKILISQIEILDAEKTLFESVGRSPNDQPIVCCAVSMIKNELRIAFGGFREYPVLAYKGPLNKDAWEIAAETLKDADDEWASGNYRFNAGKALAKRMVESLG
jgi:CO/xanthine dehydrogenase FAD-binding subunit